MNLNGQMYYKYTPATLPVVPKLHCQYDTLMHCYLINIMVSELHWAVKKSCSLLKQLWFGKGVCRSEIVWRQPYTSKTYLTT